MTRQTLLTVAEVDAFKQRHIHKSENQRYLLLRKADALEAIIELKILQIPISGIDYWYPEPDGNLVQAPSDYPLLDHFEEPNWITNQLDEYASMIQQGDPDHVGEEAWVELVLPFSERSIDDVNRSKAVAEAVRLPPIQWNTPIPKSGG